MPQATPQRMYDLAASCDDLHLRLLRARTDRAPSLCPATGTFLEFANASLEQLAHHSTRLLATLQGPTTALLDRNAKSRKPCNAVTAALERHVQGLLDGYHRADAHLLAHSHHYLAPLLREIHRDVLEQAEQWMGSVREYIAGYVRCAGDDRCLYEYETTWLPEFEFTQPEQLAELVRGLQKQEEFDRLARQPLTSTQPTQPSHRDRNRSNGNGNGSSLFAFGLGLFLGTTLFDDEC